ncbi:MAG: hypothetical protein QG670_2688 [Thermoproteota archaeon]|nr:hypothetical protein [Thermoproteota archaeon]
MEASAIPKRNQDEGESAIIRLSWNRNDLEEVKMAEAKFKEYVRSGWLAYYLNVDKEKVQIFSFNPDLEEVFLIPLVEGG